MFALKELIGVFRSCAADENNIFCILFFYFSFSKDIKSVISYTKNNNNSSLFDINDFIINFTLFLVFSTLN